MCESVSDVEELSRQSLLGEGREKLFEIISVAHRFLLIVRANPSQSQPIPSCAGLA
jgi:hypothetical protein